MQELAESTALLDDPAALRRAFATDGYVFVRGLLPAPEVAQVRRDIVGVLTRAEWLDADATVDRPLPATDAAPWRDAYFDAYAQLQALQSFHELGHHERVVGVVRSLLGDDAVLVHPRKIVRTGLPHDDDYTPAHQDYRHVQGSVDTLTVWTPVGDCPTSLGGLRVLEGSHHDGLGGAVAVSGVGGLAVEADDDDVRWRTSSYRAGDVVIFSSITVHGAIRNDEDYFRLSADYRYQLLSEPVTEASLLPHGHPAVPAWDELTAGWTSAASVAAPAGVRVAEAISPFDPDMTVPSTPLLTPA